MPSDRPCRSAVQPRSQPRESLGTSSACQSNRKTILSFNWSIEVYPVTMTMQNCKVTALTGEISITCGIAASCTGGKTVVGCSCKVKWGISE